MDFEDRYNLIVKRIKIQGFDVVTEIDIKKIMKEKIVKIFVRTKAWAYVIHDIRLNPFPLTTRVISTSPATE